MCILTAESVWICRLVHLAVVPQQSRLHLLLPSGPLALLHCCELPLQGNISSPKAAQPLVAEGPFCLLPNRFGGPEPAALPQSSPALARHGSIARMQLEPFIPANVTPDVERRLHVTSPLLLIYSSL